MPLARIITDSPESTTSLSHQLQQQGFTVELARPGDTQLAPADLEIQFELCDQQQALYRAAELARQLHTEVAVFPGAVQPEPAPVPVEPEPLVQANSVISSQSPEAAPQSQIPAEEPEFSYELPAVTGNFFTNLGSELRKGWQQTTAGFGEATKELRGMLHRSGEKLRKTRTGITTIASSTAGTVATRAHEYQEQLKQRAAEARTAREARQAELKRERAEAQARDAVIEQERQKEKVLAEAIRQEEREQQRIEKERQRAALEQEKQKKKEAAAAAAVDTPQQVFQPVFRRRARGARPKRSQLQGVLTGAIAASFLFLVGLTLANFHPFSPIPSHMNQTSVEQHLPFGAATVHGAPAPARPAVAQQPVRPQPQMQARKAPAPVVTHKSRAQQRHVRRRSSNSEDDAVADDVVVRHLPSTHKQLAQHSQPVGLKKYSDMQ
jgi:hypothetical protein